MGNLSFMYGIDVDNYLFDIRKLLQMMMVNLNKICYISLNKSGESVYEFCKENNFDLKKMIVVDMVSSRFKKCSSERGIIYLEVQNLEKELKAITQIIQKNRCSAILFDSLSTLQIYYDEKDFMKFAHDLLVFTESQHIITHVILQKEDMETSWARSLRPLVSEVKEVKFNNL
jgi:KaiC/GvpD/RAD55 family RecA-like ATPase